MVYKKGTKTYAHKHRPRRRRKISTAADGGAQEILTVPPEQLAAIVAKKAPDLPPTVSPSPLANKVEVKAPREHGGARRFHEHESDALALAEGLPKHQITAAVVREIAEPLVGDFAG